MTIIFEYEYIRAKVYTLRWGDNINGDVLSRDVPLSFTCAMMAFYVIVTLTLFLLTWSCVDFTFIFFIKTLTHCGSFVFIYSFCRYQKRDCHSA